MLGISWHRPATILPSIVCIESWLVWTVTCKRYTTWMSSTTNASQSYPKPGSQVPAAEERELSQRICRTLCHHSSETMRKEWCREIKTSADMCFENFKGWGRCSLWYKWEAHYTSVSFWCISVNSSRGQYPGGQYPILEGFPEALLFCRTIDNQWTRHFGSPEQTCRIPAFQSFLQGHLSRLLQSQFWINDYCQCKRLSMLTCLQIICSCCFFGCLSRGLAHYCLESAIASL